MRNSSCPGASVEFNRMTAPEPKTITVFVDSEKGSRLSLPSIVRAPFTVIGISSATGCCFIAESPGAAAAEPLRVVSRVVVTVSESLMMGGISCTSAKQILRRAPRRLRSGGLFSRGSTSYIFRFTGESRP